MREKARIAHNMENLRERVEDLEQLAAKLDKTRLEDTTMILILFEALLAATSEPGSPFNSAKKAREILALAGE